MLFDSALKVFTEVALIHGQVLILLNALSSHSKNQDFEKH